ncbi:MAG: hypothetical protein Q9160_006788 [Pyrenula sp. 1 TL-2023]
MPQLLKCSIIVPRTANVRRPGPFFTFERNLQTQTRATAINRTKAQPQTQPQPQPSESPFPSTRFRSSSSSLPTSSSPSTRPTLRSLFGLTSPPPSNYIPAPFTGANNPYTTRKSWPPDFSKLAERDRFHYEKTFRRRMKLKWARPVWTKSIKILQWGLVWGVLGYWVFFLEVEEGRTPFKDFRKWLSGTGAGILVDPEPMRQPRETPRNPS